MINDRIGNSILYSIKTYIQEIRWDKNYSGLRPLTITWTKEAIEELNMESRSFIYNFLDENISKFFLENDILILVVDLKSERIRYYSDENRKMYNFKISNFEKLYSNILYVINKMNEIQNYREINKKLETLLLEDKMRFNPFHYIYFKNSSGNIFLHKDITDIVEELFETEDTKIKKFFRNIAFYLYYLCIDKDIEITVPMIYEFIEKMSDDIVHEFKIMASLTKNDNDIFITHFNYDKNKNIIPFQNLDMIEEYPEIKKGIDPYLRNELKSLIEYGNDNLINIKKELLKNWKLLKNNKFSQILSSEDLKIEEKLKEKEVSKVFLIVDDKDIEKYSILLRLLILTLTKNNYDMFSNKRTLFILNEHKRIGKQIFFKNEFSYLEKENIKTIAILKRETLEKYPEKDFSDNFATELLVNNDEVKYKYQNKYDLPYELILRKGK